MGKHKPQHANGSTNEGGSKKDPEFYARLWFDALARFHRVGDPGNWQFTEQDVIDFLRSKLKQGMPTWKRLKIVEGILWYRNHVRKSATPRLEMIRSTLQRIDLNEKWNKEDQPIDRSGREDQSEGIGCDPNAPENTAIAPKGRQYREGVCRQSASLHEGTRTQVPRRFRRDRSS